MLHHAIRTRGGIQRQRHHRGRSLLDQQIRTTGLVAKPGGRTTGEPLDAARTVGTKRMAKRARGVHHIR